MFSDLRSTAILDEVEPCAISINSSGLVQDPKTLGAADDDDPYDDWSDDDNDDDPDFDDDEDEEFDEEFDDDDDFEDGDMEDE